MKKNFFSKLMMAAVLGIFMLSGPTGEALANGTETLGPPDIAIAAGTGVVTAGTGLIDPPQPGTINITVPQGATVKQVLL